LEREAASRRALAPTAASRQKRQRCSAVASLSEWTTVERAEDVTQLLAIAGKRKRAIP